MILITTSDYFPQIGGLTSFTQNIIDSLKENKIEYDLFHWKNVREIRSFDQKKLDQYELIINVHPMFCWLANNNHEKMINFIHGSEIMMTSKNIFKKIIKKFNKNNFFKKMYNAKNNFFISDFTRAKIQELGYQVQYSRDIVFHNNIKVDSVIDEKIEKTNINDEIKLVCVARNVPHKNISGCVLLGELLAKMLERPVSLVLSPGINLKSNTIKISNLKDFSDEERNKSFKSSHYNLLLSKDCSSEGFFEGFGLTVLEAAVYETPSIVLRSGGLPEAVHHMFNGIVLDEISDDDIAKYKDLFSEISYRNISNRAREHVRNNHSIDLYSKLIIKILGR